MKKYKYNLFLIILTIILFPIIYFVSKKVFKKYKDFCHNYQTEGKNEQGIELNTFEYYKWNLSEMKLPNTKLNKSDLIEYNLISKKGNISCLKVLNKNSTKWVIGLHGWTEDKYLGLRLVEHFYLNGYNILTFDSFAHGKTYGSKTDIGLSTIEIIDFIIKDLLKNNNVESIGLIGNSMGASTSVLYSQIGEYKQNINWVIEDCGFSSLKILYRKYLQKNYAFKPWWLVGYNVTNRFSHDTKVDHNKFNLLKNMDKSCNTPILFAHAKGDSWIPYEMSVDMYNKKIKFEKEIKSILWTPEGSEHVYIISDYYNDYVNKTLNFAKQNEEKK